MSLLSMPIILFNLGGEMMYILEQRLKAQSIPDNKATIVLNDVIRTLCNPKFLDEVFRPQEPFSPTSMRGIFNRLAHSSIMKLSEASMDKLFDLMTMGVKYQALSCVYPQELLQVTANHLSYLRQMVSSNSQVSALVDAAQERVTRLYGGLSLGAMHALRRTVLLFFQDKRVKVSIFLQDGLQKSDGELVTSAAGLLPPGFDTPGRVRRYDGQGGGSVLSAFTVDVPNAPACVVVAGTRPPTLLGSNMYAKDRKSAAAAPPAAAVPAPEPLPAYATDATAAAARPPAAPSLPAGKAAAEELDALAAMLGADTADGFTLSLNFGPEADDGGPARPAARRTESASVPVAVFDHRERRLDERLASILDELSVGEGRARGGAPAAPAAAADDLLALMDGAV